MIYFLVFLSQLVFNVLKVLEIRYTYEQKTARLLVNSVFINLVSLLGFYYSIDTLITNKNYWVVVFYVLGSVLGKYVGMKYEWARGWFVKTLSKRIGSQKNSE